MKSPGSPMTSVCSPNGSIASQDFQSWAGPRMAAGSCSAEPLAFITDDRAVEVLREESKPEPVNVVV